MAFRQLCIHALKTCPRFHIGLRIFALQCAQLVDRDHWESGVNGAEDLPLLISADAIRQLGEALVQPAPVRDSVGNRGRHQNGTQTRDVLVADRAANTAPLNKTHLQPRGCLAEPDDMLWHNSREF